MITPLSITISSTNAALAIAGLLVVLGGCAEATYQGRHVETSGFLGDYTQLQPGKDNEALLIYVNSKAGIRRYDQIIMDPIKIYPGTGGTTLRRMAPADAKKLVDYFDATIRNQLGGKYQFVTHPGPGVMRFRIALTEADPAIVPLDVISSVLPPAVALNALKTMAVGRGTGIGEASVEFEALDTATGERLGAFVDKRVGRKYTGRFDKFNRWRAVQDAFDYWAQQLGNRLDRLREGKGIE
ncbi:MAG: DUF3313 domain-containing protein [bacterium]|nr:DUF3313 domain-containing protein [bacterium]